MAPRRKFDLSLLPERPDISFERRLWEQGIHLIAGVDEAGRGALAGPVAVGAVVLPGEVEGIESELAGVRDSKVMTPKDRQTWAEVIKTVALAWGVGMASSREIDNSGIVPGTYLAAARALSKLQVTVEHLLVDYITLPGVAVPQTPLVKGDARSLSIASAAILAKTTRDALLVELDGQYPGYAFASNKGYGTATHRKAIQRLGPCAQHRCTFSPVKEFYSLFPPTQEK